MLDDPKDIAARIQPALHAFTQAMSDAGLTASALIFDPEGAFLIRAGNCDREGADFVRLHFYLALVIAQLHATGQYSDFSVTDAPTGETPASIAAALALACITVPSDMLPDRIRTLAQDYLSSVGE